MGNRKAKAADHESTRVESSKAVPSSPVLRDPPGSSRKGPADSDSHGRKSKRERESVELFDPVSDVRYAHRPNKGLCMSRTQFRFTRCVYAEF
jgi:hypothetical protein